MKKIPQFSMSAHPLLIGSATVRLWALFHRVFAEGRFWGIGFLQVGQRHLLYVGNRGIRLLFLGRLA